VRRFRLIRDVDVSGISGTGEVAEGVEFTAGEAVVRWHGDTPSIVFWSGGEQHMMRVHGHGGYTHIEWLDEAA